MARSRSILADLKPLVQRFAAQLASIVDEHATGRARDAVLGALGRAAGRARKVIGRATGKRRKKAPVQMCPVPGCKNRAAPVFGMVCAKHKDLPKAQVRKYREARRRAKEKAAKAEAKKAA